jgi:metallophosphoesterase (TIGR00282 family)
MRILAIGDIFGEAAQRKLRETISDFKRENKIDLCIVNGENADGASGCEADSIRGIFGAGADIVTGGNHSLRYQSMKEMLDSNDSALRPANFAPQAHGFGYTIKEACGVRVLCVNLIGSIGLERLCAVSPFEKLDSILRFEDGNYDIAVVDFHAEATSEKAALAHAFSERVSAVWGTHTHVQTADERIIGGRCGFITDIGMSGPEDGIIGVRTEDVLDLFLTKKTSGFKTASGEVFIRGAIFELDQDLKCISVKRIKY